MREKFFPILIADDDAEDLEIIEESILKVDPNVRVLKVSIGRAALDYLSKADETELPKLIILDYNMPEMKGSEVLVIIGKQNRFQSIPKFILSTSNEPFHIKESLNSGATEYFIKPDSQRALDELVKKILSYIKRS